jgi:hypothetical protein
MLTSLTNSSERLLDPMERISEILFALIMVLTFTCSFSVAHAGREEVRAMLVGALGCNLAWGIIDGVFYLMGSFSVQGHKIVQWKALRAAASPEDAHRIISDALPPLIASVLTPSEIEGVRQKLTQLTGIPEDPQLKKADWLGALGVFLLVFLSTLPVVFPFVFINNPKLALRLSNLVAIIMLFLIGFRFGQYADHHPWKMGISMVILGAVLVGTTISLGG